MKRPRPKYQVFISSTFADLRLEREAVTWAILEARQIPAGMENFTAADDRGWELIRRAIDLSDYYVLILGGRYGSFDDSAEMSWTHREYRYARDKSIPILAYIRDPASVTADKMESEPEQQTRLRDFIAEVKSRHLCKSWKQADDLRHEVVQALTQKIMDDEDADRARPGWFRGDELPSAISMDEFARLSAEAADLRRLLAEHSSRKAVLSLAWRDGDDNHDFVVSRERLVLDGPDVDPFGRPSVYAGQSPTNRLADMNRSFPLDLILRNSGAVAARNITVDIEIGHAAGLVVYPTSTFSPNRNPWQLDAQQHVYVDRWSEPDPKIGRNVANMRQRVRLIAPSGSEELVGVTLYLDANQTQVNLTYQVRDEDGATAEGSLRGTLNITGTRTVTSEEARDLE